MMLALTCLTLLLQREIDPSESYLLTPNGVKKVKEVFSQPIENNKFPANGLQIYSLGKNGAITGTSGSAFSHAFYYHFSNGKLKEIMVPGNAFPAYPASVIPEGMFCVPRVKGTTRRKLLLYYNNENSATAVIDCPLSDENGFRSIATYSATQPCIVIASTAPSNKLATTHLYDTGTWHKLSLENQNLIFAPEAVCKSGAVVGSAFKPHGNDFGITGNPDPYGMEYQSHHNLRPVIWQNGKFTFIPLPPTIESLTKNNIVDFRLLMEWNGNYLAHLNNQDNEYQEYHGYYIYKDKAWKAIIPPRKNSNTPEEMNLTDYDLNSGRILLSNQLRYKVVQL